MSEHGVYLHSNKNGDCLYVGKTGNISKRTESHKFTSCWAKNIEKIDFIKCADDEEATHLERDLVRNIKPKFNKNYKRLPSDAEFQKMHLVFGINEYYDNSIEAFGIDGDHGLSLFLRVSEIHIKMVRAGMVGITAQEKRIIANKINCSPYEIKNKFSNRKFEILRLSSQIKRWQDCWK